MVNLNYVTVPGGYHIACGYELDPSRPKTRYPACFPTFSALPVSDGLNTPDPGIQQCVWQG